MGQLGMSGILVSCGVVLVAVGMGGAALPAREVLGVPRMPAHLGLDEAVPTFRPTGLV